MSMALSLRKQKELARGLSCSHNVFVKWERLILTDLRILFAFRSSFKILRLPYKRSLVRRRWGHRLGKESHVETDNKTRMEKRRTWERTGKPVTIDFGNPGIDQPEGPNSGQQAVSDLYHFTKCLLSKLYSGWGKHLKPMASKVPT